MRRWATGTKLPPSCLRRSQSHRVRRGTLETRRSSIPTDRDKVMNYTEFAVVPAAFALLSAMLMFSGGTKRFVEAAKSTAAVIRVALFLLCTLVAIAIGSATD